MTVLRLKDQYAVDPENPGEITVGVDYETVSNTYKGTEFDFDTFTSSNKQKYRPWKDNRSESNTSYMYFDQENARAFLKCEIYYEYAEVDKDQNRTDTWTVQNYEIVNIAGTINLINN